MNEQPPENAGLYLTALILGFILVLAFILAAGAVVGGAAGM